jgi:hypothetical protein
MCRAEGSTGFIIISFQCAVLAKIRERASEVINATIAPQFSLLALDLAKILTSLFVITKLGCWSKAYVRFFATLVVCMTRTVHIFRATFHRAKNGTSIAIFISMCTYFT